MTNHNFPKDDTEKTRELPRLVEVEIGGEPYLGSMYERDAVPGTRLMIRPMPAGYEMIELKPYSRIIVLFEEGQDPVHILVMNPAERDNDQRVYAFTSRSMQAAAMQSGGDNALQIPHESILGLVIQPGERLEIVGEAGHVLRSNANVSAVITCNPEGGTLNKRLVGKYPKIDL